MPQPGTGNIFSNPLFQEPDNLDYSLLITSHCIDAGDPEETDPDDTTVDIGALYFHQENTYQNGDCNADGFVNVIDIILLINTCILSMDDQDLCIECGDSNQDGSIDILDVVYLINLIIN